MNDRVIPLLMISLLIASIGFLWRLPDEGVAPNLSSAFPDDGARSLLVGKKLDINTVTAADLKLIPKLSWRIAKAIEDFRHDARHIASIDELADVKGVGPKTLERLKEFVEVKKQLLPLIK